MSDRYNNFSIELDCPPGMLRPDSLIADVLKDTGLEESDFETGAPFFGNQTWVLKESAGKDDLYTQVRHETIKPRVISLYNAGAIRYGSW